MLTEEQKMQIELYYKDFANMGEHSHLNGIDYILEVIGEVEFKEYLYEEYR